MEASFSMEKTGLEGWGLFFSAIGDFCQRMYWLPLSPMPWLFIFSLDVVYWQSRLQSLGALLRVTFIWRMLKHRGNNYKQQLQDIFHPKGHRKKPAQLWTMRVQLRIGANPFIKLAQIPQADNAVQCGDFWVNTVSLDLLPQRWIGIGINSLLLTMGWVCLPCQTALCSWSSTMVSQSHGGSPGLLAWTKRWCELLHPPEEQE